MISDGSWSMPFSGLVFCTIGLLHPCLVYFNQLQFYVISLLMVLMGKITRSSDKKFAWLIHEFWRSFNYLIFPERLNWHRHKKSYSFNFKWQIYLSNLLICASFFKIHFNFDRYVNNGRNSGHKSPTKYRLIKLLVYLFSMYMEPTWPCFTMQTHYLQN